MAGITSSSHATASSSSSSHLRPETPPPAQKRIRLSGPSPDDAARKKTEACRDSIGMGASQSSSFSTFRVDPLPRNLEKLKEKAVSILADLRNRGLWGTQMGVLNYIGSHYPELLHYRDLDLGDLKIEYDFRLAQSYARCKKESFRALPILDRLIATYPNESSDLFLNIRQLAVFVRLRSRAAEEVEEGKNQIEQLLVLRPDPAVLGSFYEDVASHFEMNGELGLSLDYLNRAKDLPLSDSRKEEIEVQIQRIEGEMPVFALREKIKGLPLNAEERPATIFELSKLLWRRDRGRDRTEAKELVREVRLMMIMDPDLKANVEKVYLRMKETKY